MKIANSEYYEKHRSCHNVIFVDFSRMPDNCQNYWTETGPMNEIADCIEHNIDAVRDREGVVL